MLKHTSLVVLFGLSTPLAALPEHSVMHGMEISDDLPVPAQLDQWLVSEKYDGIRAYWNGHQLLTRNGYPINIPESVTADWPDEHLEGELWIGYRQFDVLSALIRSHKTTAQDWQAVRFLLFDLPHWPGTFAERQARLAQLPALASATNLSVITQQQGLNHAELDRLFTQVTTRGGEGLMLHRSEALYQLQRSSDLRKLKPFQDAEAVVIAHYPGKGKYTGKMGSILVQQADGSRFRIGSGFSDAERAQPPALGSTITFRFNGLTGQGKPRFARFLRERPD